MAEIGFAGRCLCGAIRYRTAAPPLWVAHCHCESCRRATGAPVTTYAGFAAGSFAWTEDGPSTFASSPGVTRTFCGRCGTSLTYQGERWPGEVHVLAATLDRPEAVVPQGEAFAGERLPWLHLALPPKPAAQG